MEAKAYPLLLGDGRDDLDPVLKTRPELVLLVNPAVRVGQRLRLVAVEGRDIEPHRITVGCVRQTWDGIQW